MTMLYQGGSCVSCMWLPLVVLSVLMYALLRSQGMQFMLKLPWLVWAYGCFNFFLTQMWTILVPLISCRLLFCLSFDIDIVARQLCLWDFTVYLWLVSVDKAFSISSWPQTIFVWHRTLTGSRSLKLFDPEVEGTLIL